MRFQIRLVHLMKKEKLLYYDKCANLMQNQSLKLEILLAMVGQFLFVSFRPRSPRQKQWATLRSLWHYLLTNTACIGQ
jgi:hypothetical protein